MHRVAESHVDHSVDGAADFIHTNIGGTYTPLEPARDYWMRLDPEMRDQFRFLSNFHGRDLRFLGLEGYCGETMA